MSGTTQFGWMPSTARVVIIEGFGPVPRGTVPALPAVLAWPAKDPSDVLDYIVDVSEAIAGNEGDAINSLSVTISPSNADDLALQSSVAEGTQAVLWLAQGVSGTTYAVTVVIGTNAGRLLSRTVNLPVVSMSSVAPPANAIVDNLGAPLTDGTGAALTTG